jgi:hypothetical protein
MTQDQFAEENEYEKTTRRWLYLEVIFNHHL